MASLPSTVTRVSGSFSHLAGGNGAFFCASALAGKTKLTHNSASKLLRLLVIFRLIFLPGPSPAESRVVLLTYQLTNFCATSLLKFAFCQSTGAFQSSQGSRICHRASNSCFPASHLLKVRMHPFRPRMARRMPKALPKFTQIPFLLAPVLLFAAVPLRAQLVGDPGPPPASQMDSVKPQPPVQTPLGKSGYRKISRSKAIRTGPIRVSSCSPASTC